MNLGELFKTKRWKTFMGFVYGWGAAVVLMGALFKLEHWQYSSLLLTIGLSTEALIFFLSAFEPPMELPEWSKVYPELKEDYEVLELEQIENRKKKDLGDLFSSSELTPDLLNKVEKGLNELSNTAKGISDISTATLATDMYVKNLGSASESMSNFAEINNKANQSINDSVGVLVQSYAATAQKLSDTNLGAELEKVKESSSQYTGNLDRLNGHLTQLNSTFESQLQGTTEQFKASQKFSQDLDNMNSILASSVDELKKYKENAEKLNKHLESLNTIYGNMLGAMSYKK